MTPYKKRKFDTDYAKYQRLLILQGYSKATIDNYTRGIRRLPQWCGKCPDQGLTKADFEDYFSQLIQTHSWRTIKCDRNAFMRYWELVLEQDWQYINLVKPPLIKHLPDILVTEEINRTFSCVYQTHYQVYLYTVYTLGIRLSEGLYLQVSDIDGKTKRVHIREGKGCKDRFVILPDNTYKVLQQFWQTHRHKKWIFPSLQANHQETPMDKGSAQKSMRLALKQAILLPSGLPKQWVANIRNVGCAEKALKYLSRYLYRGVISENDILADHEGNVTFRYKDSQTNKFKKLTQKAEDFLWGLLKHVLPRGFRRVRDYGFLHGNATKVLKKIQLFLHVKRPAPSTDKKSMPCPSCRSDMTIKRVLVKRIPIQFLFYYEKDFRRPIQIAPT